MMMDLHDYRKNYLKDSINEQQLPVDPFQLFRAWFQLANDNQLPDANAMVLSTVSGNRPSSRVVLLKELNNNGFVFYTNYSSRKGAELAANPNAALNFFWPLLEKQIRVEGEVGRIAEEASELYFESRPFESRVSALISPQSQVVACREELEEKQRFFLGKPEHIKRPTHWGGYCLVPVSIEFWQGRADRLHDRIRYFRHDGGWDRERLAP
jgi:pyridoxamine 5'-phosphate oxidase